MALRSFKGGLRHVRWTRLAVVAAVLVVAGAAAAAAVGTGNRAAGDSVRRPVLKLRKTAIGKILVNRAGRTLYMFARDRHRHSVCYRKCAHFWPPVLTKKRGKARTLGGVHRRLVGRTRRKNGSYQLTYRKHPLYRFKFDRRAGQLTGQRLPQFGGRWYVLSRTGRPVKKAVEAPPTTTTTTTTTPTTTTNPGGGGWG